MANPNSVFVTGAKTGLGLEFVRQFASMDQPPKHIFASGRNVQKTEALVELKNKYGNIVHLVELDVTNDQEIANAVKTVTGIVGDAGLNLLINSAGVYLPEDDAWPNIKRDAVKRMVDVQATSKMLMAQAFFPLLKKAADKHAKEPMSITKAAIVNVSDESGSFSAKIHFSCNMFGIHGYSASMGALYLFIKNLSYDLKPDGILIVGISPGYVDTPIARQFLEFGKAQKAKGFDMPVYLEESGLSTPAEAVEDYLKTMRKLTDEHTGGQFSRKGEKTENTDWFTEGAK